MKVNLSFRFILVVFCLIVVSSVYSQTKPDPVKNATFDMLMGEWVADSYEMMGSKWTETTNHYMKYGQYMFVDIMGKNDKGETYNGTVIIKPNMDGSFIGWAFDDWGSVTNYTGTAKDNKVSLSGKSEWGSETRDIEINGNTMVHKASWTMKDKDGKDMSMNQTITYHKK